MEDHDATVFFSVNQLLRHLASHARPLPKVSGITTVYGFQHVDVVNFDIHFTSQEPKLQIFNMREISQKVATRPSAVGTTTFHPKNSHRDAQDPNGDDVLHFAIGARIVAITFPERFSGTWCRGYHDGGQGSFPASAISLEKPAKEDVLMDPQSTLITTAKWDFKPKDTKDGDWLRFSKGDKIFCIGYTFPDSWCWSGQNSKGKWGLFPAVFVENCQERPAGLSRRESGFSIPKMSLLSRNKSKVDNGGPSRKMSVLSNGTGEPKARNLKAKLLEGQEESEVVSSLYGGRGPVWR